MKTPPSRRPLELLTGLLVGVFSVFCWLVFWWRQHQSVNMLLDFIVIVTSLLYDIVSSLWIVSFETYEDASATNRNVMDWRRAVLNLLAQVQCSIPYVYIGLITVLYTRTNWLNNRIITVSNQPLSRTQDSHLLFGI